MNITANHRKWWVILGTSLALGMIFVDMSALPIALPSIQSNLGASQNALHWIMNAYLLSFAVLIILGGKLGDRVGHRKVFMSGSGLFIFSSVLCAIAPESEWVIVARILQGVGGALMMPAASPLFRSVVEPEEIGKMAGIYVSIASVFLIMGPTLGGFLTEYLSWRSIFWINVPLGFISIAIVWLIVPRDQPTKIKISFDWSGFSWSTIALVTLVYGLMEGATLGWSSPIIIGCLGISLMAILIFFYAIREKKHPFIDLKLFKNHHFAYSIYILMIMQCVFMATVFWAIFFQDMLKLSAAKAGMLMLAAQAPLFFSSHAAGRMFDRYGPRFPSRIGALLLTVSSLWMAVFCWTSNYWWLFPGLLLFGVGTPFINLTNISSVVSSVPASQRGMASGISSAVRQIGGAVGLALLGAMMNQVSLWQLKNVLPHGIESVGRLEEQISQVLSYHVAYLETHPVAQALYHTVQHAYTFAFCLMMVFVTVLSLTIVILSSKLPNHPIKPL